MPSGLIYFCDDEEVGRISRYQQGKLQPYGSLVCALPVVEAECIAGSCRVTCAYLWSPSCGLELVPLCPSPYMRIWYGAMDAM